MKKLNLNIDIIDNRNKLGKPATWIDVKNKIKKDTIVSLNNKKIIVYGSMDKIDKNLIMSLREVKYQSNNRMARIKIKFKTTRPSDICFGYNPMSAPYSIPAGACEFNSLYPETYEALSEAGRMLTKLYGHYFESELSLHKDAVNESILDDYLISGTPFTQGIINNSNNLDYHYDAANFTGCLSCMIVFKKGVIGGDLIIPDINSGLIIEDSTFVMFDGQKFLHGVTDIHKTHKNGFRYSVVYYSSRRLKNAKSHKEEFNKLKRSQNKVLV